MPTIIDKISAVTKSATAAELLTILNEIASGVDAQAVKEYIVANLENERDSMAVPLNVAIAGATGLVKGSKYLWPVDGAKRAYEVNPFLHQLRLAMLQCDPLRVKMRENASTHFFYPEFFSGTVTMADRIVRIAMAHEDMDPSNTETIPLYSLGGYFNFTDTKAALPKQGARGTTCIMTARAVYHAAGANMIGAKPPVVGTPGGPDVELGRPSAKVVQNGAKRNTQLSPTVEREKFVDVNPQEPPLAVGDVYLIQGHGNAQYLLRPGMLDLAAHVGVVIGKTGRTFRTMDGGQGLGNKITIKDQALTFDPGWGWSLGESKSFSVEHIDNVAAKLAQYDTDEALLKWIQGDARGAMYRKQLDDLEKDKRLAKNDAQREMIEKQRRPVLLGNARRLVKQVEGEVKGIGRKRTVQGWWRPSMYAELGVVGDRGVTSKLG